MEYLYLGHILALIGIGVSMIHGVTSDQVIKIQYTVENMITEDDRVFRASMHMETLQIPFHDIMLEAAAIDSRYRFRTASYPDFGHYVIELNGIHEDLDRKRHWVLLKRDHPSFPGQDCSLLHAGISTYTPYEGDHLVFAYEDATILEKIPVCPVP